MPYDNEALRPDSAAVIKYLEMYQGIITRMAGNSADCKKWAVTLVSAILVLTAREQNPTYAAFVVVPALVFWFLDAYYLALEKQFRHANNAVIRALHAGRLYPEHLYIVRATGKLPRTFLEAFLSWAVWPFYLGLILTVVLVRELVDYTVA